MHLGVCEGPAPLLIENFVSPLDGGESEVVTGAHEVWTEDHYNHVLTNTYYEVVGLCEANEEVPLKELKANPEFQAAMSLVPTHTARTVVRDLLQSMLRLEDSDLLLPQRPLEHVECAFLNGETKEEAGGAITKMPLPLEHPPDNAFPSGWGD